MSTIRAGVFGAATVLGALAAPMALAQSDGSIEEAYARQCPHNEQTQLCASLRDLIRARPTGKGAPAALKSDASPRAFLGVTVIEIDEATAKDLGLRPGAGALVTGVSPGSPAQTGGLKQNDIITSVGGEPVTTEASLPTLVARHPVGQPLGLMVVRAKRPLQLTVTPGAVDSVELERSNELMRHVTAIGSGTPDYERMAPEIAEFVRSNPHLPGVFAAFGVARAIEKIKELEGGGVYRVSYDGSKVEFTGRVGPDGKLIEFRYQDSRRFNADRALQKKMTFLDKTGQVDRIAPGMAILGVWEKSDGSTRSFLAREDCYEIVAPQGQALRFTIRTGGTHVNAQVGEYCWYNSPSYDFAGFEHDFSLRFVQGGKRLYARVEGWRAEGREYRVELTPMSAQEIAEWRHEEQLAAQRKAEERAALGQMLATGVAIAGVAAVGGDVSAVPLTGNPLEILDGANAEIARQNQISQARLDATLANARRSGTAATPSGSGGVQPQVAPSAPAPVRALAGVPQPRGQTMYGFCWASQTSAGDSPIYHSQIGRTDKYLNGATTDFPDVTWQSRMEAEFATQIGAHVGLICYANPSPNGFDYNISTNRQGHRIIEVPWRPH